MLYEESFLNKVFSNSAFHGGGNEYVAGYPILKHLSIPLGLHIRPFPSTNIINAEVILDVMESDKYDVLYEKTLDTHKGRNTRREKPPKISKRITKRRFFQFR